MMSDLLYLGTSHVTIKLKKTHLMNSVLCFYFIAKTTFPSEVVKHKKGKSSQIVVSSFGLFFLNI